MPRGKRKGAPASAEERIAKIKREGPVVGVNDPDDPTPRKEIDVKKLDLDKSYVGSIKPQRSTRPEKDRPWEFKERDLFTMEEVYLSVGIPGRMILIHLLS
ncbi:uncharacterized protein N7469_006147 [Penicillium citrinum]|uniref:Uncharacterized protein n=1 Tax=Penicillium citrinum TaxID=5077 RepID=A0A9W9NXD9_PENCI|nr:uncharacterized protein N7469_006147 [Penicillium citrinum]KAJ5231559.1 hypothetical protein N7469_006147 [Penicillium citrinum]